jgi:hypothetical protein
MSHLTAEEANDKAAHDILTLVTENLAAVPCRIKDITEVLHDDILHESVKELVAERVAAEDQNLNVAWTDFLRAGTELGLQVEEIDTDTIVTTIKQLKDQARNTSSEARRLNELVAKLDEYIARLDKEIDSLVGIASVHGWRSTEEAIADGIRLRAEIEALR